MPVRIQKIAQMHIKLNFQIREVIPDYLHSGDKMAHKKRNPVALDP